MEKRGIKKYLVCVIIGIFLIAIGIYLNRIEEINYEDGMGSLYNIKLNKQTKELIVVIDSTVYETSSKVHETYETKLTDEEYERIKRIRSYYKDYTDIIYIFEYLAKDKIQTEDYLNKSSKKITSRKFANLWMDDLLQEIK